jgi:hypothetical protein
VLHASLNAHEYQAHRGVCETEAESVAYVLANLLGLDVDASSISYINWLVTLRPDRAQRRRHGRAWAVNTIAGGLGLDNLDDADQAADHVSAA